MKKYYTYKNKENLQQEDVKENPLDLLDEVDLIEIDDNSLKIREFYEVEKKTSRSKLKLGASLNLKGFISASFEYLKGKSETNPKLDCDNQLVSDYYSKLASSGYYSQIASSGDCSKLASSGDYSKLASSGGNSKIELKGYESIAFCAGETSLIKGKKGNWITLSEFENKKPIMVKSAQIGNEEYKDYKGNVLKEDTFYMLINKEFAPTAIIDDFKMIIVSNTKCVDGYNIFKTQYYSDFKEGNKIYQYIAEKNGYTAHGKTIKEAIEDVEFKRLRNMNIDEHIKRIKEQGYMTANDYRLITGACRYGTNKFLEENNLTWEDKKSVEDVLKLVKGEYGYSSFKNFVDKYMGRSNENESNIN